LKGFLPKISKKPLNFSPHVDKGIYICYILLYRPNVNVLKNMSDKRKFPRVDVSFPIEYKPLPARNYFYTVSKDLSLGGVKIVSNYFLPKNDTVKVNVNLIDSILGLKAKVAWCNKERLSERYSTGLEFVETSESSKKSLFQFLNRIFNV